MKEDWNLEDRSMDKLIRDSLKFDRSPEGLTDSIMNQITTVEEAKERALSSLMRKHVLVSPSSDFTIRVMAQIEKATSTSIVTNPVIIGKKAWAIIFAFLTAFVVYVLQTTEEAQADPGISGEVSSRITDFFGQLEGSLSIETPAILTNPVLAIGLFALSSLLLLDYLIKNHKMSWV